MDLPQKDDRPTEDRSTGVEVSNDAETGIELAPGIRVGEDDLKWRFSRSSGPGGQNVNKVETRVELIFNAGASRLLEPQLKEQILARLCNRVDSEGNIHIVANSSRSQWQNRKAALARLGSILDAARRPVVNRKPTRVPRWEKLKRVAIKRHRGGIKQQRVWRPGEE